MDCEMAGTKGSRSEVVAICAIDFLTGEVLVNSLVKPQQRIVNWRSDITGVSPEGMLLAVAQNKALKGWRAARDELRRFVDEDTVMVGQSLQHDLKMLRVIHTKIVDSAILTAEAVFGKKRPIRRMWGLDTLCQELLGLHIRGGSPSGELSHDGLEDALAARELVIKCLRHPDILKTWANRSRKEFWCTRSKGKKVYRTPLVEKSEGDDDRSASEVLRWEDVVDYDVWPKSPPDSD